MARDLRDEAGIPDRQLAVLANPVDVEGLRAIAQKSTPSGTGQKSDSSSPHLLAVGRLAHEKGIDLLLRALVTVREELPGVHLAIVGDGPERPALEALSRDLRLDSAVLFLGDVDSPCAWFPNASLFVLPSRHDSMPNALLEAAACGLPIVAMPASQGLVELLREQPAVWLAEEVTATALSSVILHALGQLRHTQRFPHPFIEQFRLQRSLDAYEDMIDATLRERPL
jgi:glycosyltransferase involved in cell wall biosynthesis